MRKCFWCGRQTTDPITIQIDIGLTLYACQEHMKLAISDLRKDLDMFVRFGVMAVLLSKEAAK